MYIETKWKTPFASCVEAIRRPDYATNGVEFLWIAVTERASAARDPMLSQVW